MKSKIYLLDKKIGKMAKKKRKEKNREKRKFRYSDNVMTKMASSMSNQTLLK